MLNILIGIVIGFIITTIIFICATLYTDYFMRKIAQSVQRLDKGIPIIEKTRKQTLTSEEMRMEQINKRSK